MKKMSFALLFLLTAASLKAEGIGDQITASLIDHVAAHTQYTTKGENRLALLASIVQIGKYKGSSIAQLRFGFTGIMNPDNQVTRGAGYVGDIYFNVSPLIREYVTLNPDWTFLKSIEAGPTFSYDFREKHSYAGISIGLAFSLNPKP